MATNAWGDSTSSLVGPSSGLNVVKREYTRTTSAIRRFAIKDTAKTISLSATQGTIFVEVYNGVCSDTTQRGLGVLSDSVSFSAGTTVDNQNWYSNTGLYSFSDTSANVKAYSSVSTNLAGPYQREVYAIHNLSQSGLYFNVGYCCYYSNTTTKMSANATGYYAYQSSATSYNTWSAYQAGSGNNYFSITIKPGDDGINQWVPISFSVTRGNSYTFNLHTNSEANCDGIIVSSTSLSSGSVTSSGFCRCHGANATTNYIYTPTSNGTVYIYFKTDSSSNNNTYGDVEVITAPVTTAVTLYKSDGSGGTDSITATYGSAMPSVVIPTRTNYTFLGYYDATSGGTQYITSSGTSARTWDKIDSTKILYAQWQLNTVSYTVTFSKNGGSGGTSSTTVNSGSSITSITLPTRTNLTFDGYYTSTTGGTCYVNKYGAGVKDVTSSITLYAHWRNTITTSYTLISPSPSITTNFDEYSTYCTTQAEARSTTDSTARLTVSTSTSTPWTCGIGSVSTSFYVEGASSTKRESIYFDVEDALSSMFPGSYVGVSPKVTFNSLYNTYNQGTYGTLLSAWNDFVGMLSAYTMPDDTYMTSSLEDIVNYMCVNDSGYLDDLQSLSGWSINSTGSTITLPSGVAAGTYTVVLKVTSPSSSSGNTYVSDQKIYILNVEVIETVLVSAGALTVRYNPEQYTYLPVTAFTLLVSDMDNYWDTGTYNQNLTYNNGATISRPPLSIYSFSWSGTSTSLPQDQTEHTGTLTVSINTMTLTVTGPLNTSCTVNITSAKRAPNTASGKYKNEACTTSGVNYGSPMISVDNVGSFTISGGSSQIFCSGTNQYYTKLTSGAKISKTEPADVYWGITYKNINRWTDEGDLLGPYTVKIDTTTGEYDAYGDSTSIYFNYSDGFLFHSSMSTNAPNGTPGPDNITLMAINAGKTSLNVTTTISVADDIIYGTTYAPSTGNEWTYNEPNIYAMNNLTAAGGNLTVYSNVTNMHRFRYKHQSGQYTADIYEADPGTALWRISWVGIDGTSGNTRFHEPTSGGSTISAGGSSYTVYGTGTDITHDNMGTNAVTDQVKIIAYNVIDTSKTFETGIYAVTNTLNTTQKYKNTSGTTGQNTVYGIPTISMGSGMTPSGGSSVVTCAVSNEYTWYYKYDSGSYTSLQSSSFEGSAKWRISSNGNSAFTIVGTSSSLGTMIVYEPGDQVVHSSMSASAYTDTVITTAYNVNSSSKKATSTMSITNSLTSIALSVAANPIGYGDTTTCSVVAEYTSGATKDVTTALSVDTSATSNYIKSNPSNIVTIS